MDVDKQVAIFMQGTEYGDATLKAAMAKDLKERLVEAEKEGRPLRIYCGYDPTKADLHLGHTVTMRKLRQFQDHGHEVTFLIGNFTSLVGDPSDKDKLRPILTAEQIEENGRTYSEQAFRVLDREKTVIRYNADWLSKLTFEDLIHLASNFTIQQFITRDNFRKRWDNNDPVFLHETFYAIMQAYDAYHMRSDVQVGGTDQLFNIVTAARKLMTAKGVKPNIGITMGILPGTDGEIRMSKTLGNHIPINSGAKDMFGKIMSIPDKAMPVYGKLCTRWTTEEVEEFDKSVVESTVHPRDAKMKLALEITNVFYTNEEAEGAKQAFITQFQKGAVPDDVPEYKLQTGDTVVKIMTAQLSVSGKEARTLIKQNAVKFNDELISDPYKEISEPGILKVGKRRYLKVN